MLQWKTVSSFSWAPLASFQESRVLLILVLFFRVEAMSDQQMTDELSERSRNVLKTLIREYVRVGKPVGSRCLSKMYSEKLSPATLRNVMSDLEDAGFLSHPHTSAGRIPTQRGYQFYVRSLLDARRLSDQEVGEIKRSLEEESGLSDLMNKTSKLLSAYSNSIGIVLSPPISRVVMKHIEFIRFADRRVLVVLVDTAGLVQHRLIRVEEQLPQSELEQAGRYLVENFKGSNLMEIRSGLLRLMKEERTLYNQLMRNVILLGSAAVVAPNENEKEESEVYLEGTSRVIGRLEDSDLDKLISLLQTFEEKNRLVKIITECLRADRNVPTVTVGLEEHIPGMRNWSLITSSYDYDRNTKGSLAVLGPSRMEYGRAIGLVDCVAGLFGEILLGNTRPDAD